jgi:hypothetical protein
MNWRTQSEEGWGGGEGVGVSGVGGGGTQALHRGATSTASEQRVKSIGQSIQCVVVLCEYGWWWCCA